MKTQAIREQINEEVEKHKEKALAGKEPNLSELYSEIYAGAPPPFIRMPDFEKSIRN